jgi:hypothetical protein
MPNMPEPSAKIETGNSEAFTSFMRRLMGVPHSEIKAKLEAEREVKRTSKTASRAAAASSPNR